MSYMKQLWIEREQARVDAEMSPITVYDVNGKTFHIGWAEFEKAILAAGQAPPSGSYYPPSAPVGVGPRGQLFKVHILRGGEQWGCVVEAPSSTLPMDLDRMAQQRYGVIIDKWMKTGFDPHQPGLTRLQAASASPPMKGLKAALEKGLGHYEDDPSQIDPEGWGSDYDPVEDLQKPEPKCEADKPEGTRDVEKFLKEQQNKLWRDE